MDFFWDRSGSLSALTWLSAPIFLALVLLYVYSVSTDVPKIKGIPELPGALPFVGNLHQHAGASGVNDSRLWSEWSKKLGSDLLQVRFGRSRVVIANSYDLVKEIFITNGNLTSTRPKQHIFEKYVGYDLGSHSLDANFKPQRMAGMKALKASQWPSFYPGLDREGDRMVVNLAEEGDYGRKAVNPLKMLQIVAMNLAFQITFGVRFDNAADPWLREYIDNAMIITTVRGASNTWSDFVPLLRLHPKFHRMGKIGQAASEKRSMMVMKLLEDLKARLAAGDQADCVAASVLQDRENNLTLPNAIKCCTSMLQGSTESLPSHLCGGLGGLVSPEGEEIQQKAYADIMETYPNGDAAKHAFDEEKVPYVVALYKEILRNYTVLPFSLPHSAASDVRLKSGIVIPQGTRLYMNSEAANHDEAIYGPTSAIFDPERWLASKVEGVGHCAYGLGSRICPAWSITNRMMYGLLMRMILAFEIRMDPDDPPPPSYETFGANPEGALNSPKPFKVYFVPRDENELRNFVQKTKAQTSEPKAASLQT